MARAQTMRAARPIRPARRRPRARDRVAAWFLFALMAAGTLVLWLGIPAGSMYAASKLTDSFAYHFVIALFMTIAAMAAFAPLLFWLNNLYLRVSGVARDDDDEDEERPPRGPLEPLLVGSLVIAIIALVVWFFGFAENPSSQVL